MPTPSSNDALAASQLITDWLAVLCFVMCVIHLYCLMPPEKTLHAGANMPPVSKAAIEQNARQAAQAGTSLQDGCPYPLTTDAGRHWVAVWSLHQGQKK